MQEKSLHKAPRRRSKACIAWLAAGALAPFGGLVFRQLSILGAVVVLFAIVIAAVDAHQ
jgi:hypothetical protein